MLNIHNKTLTLFITLIRYIIDNFFLYQGIVEDHLQKTSIPPGNNTIYNQFSSVFMPLYYLCFNNISFKFVNFSNS